MTNNPLSNLKIDYWYKALLVLAACILILSLSVEMKDVRNSVVQLISLGAIFIAIGEWINHPLQEVIVPGRKYTGHPRNGSPGGILLDMGGVVLIIVGSAKMFL